MLKRLRKIAHRYSAGQSAAFAMYMALLKVETDEVLATNFAGSKKLNEIRRLTEKVQTVKTYLSGAERAISDLLLTLEREYRMQYTTRETA